MAEVNDFNGRLAELVKQVQAGDEILLTQEHKLVAKIISASENDLPSVSMTSNKPLRLRSLKGHRVLTPSISNSELADEMFGGK